MSLLRARIVDPDVCSITSDAASRHRTVDVSPIRIRWSDHALARMRMREIEAAWVERTIRNPEVIEPDPVQPGRVRVFAAVPERDGRILRVVYEPLDGEEIAVVTALLDRGRTRQRKQTR